MNEEKMRVPTLWDPDGILGFGPPPSPEKSHDI